jgi:hypothetical protein
MSVEASLVAYRDTAGRWAIGVGHAGPEARQGLTIMREQSRTHLSVMQRPLTGQCPNSWRFPSRTTDGRHTGELRIQPRMLPIVPDISTPTSGHAPIGNALVLH